MMREFFLPLLVGSSCLCHGKRAQVQPPGTFDEEDQPNTQESNALIQGHAALQTTPRHAASNLVKLFGMSFLIVGPRSRLQFNSGVSAYAPKFEGASLHTSHLNIRQTHVWSKGDRNSLVQRRSAQVVGSAVPLEDLPMMPAIGSGLGPVETLEVVCRGLQENDTPKTNAGFERLYNFLLPLSRVKMAPSIPKAGLQGDAGLEYFVKNAGEPALSCLLYCTGFKILGHNILIGARENRSFVSIEVDNTGMENDKVPTTSLFQVLLETERYPLSGVWLIKEFKRVEQFEYSEVAGGTTPSPPPIQRASPPIQRASAETLTRPGFEESPGTFLDLDAEEEEERDFSWEEIAKTQIFRQREEKSVANNASPISRSTAQANAETFLDLSDAEEQEEQPSFSREEIATPVSEQREEKPVANNASPISPTSSTAQANAETAMAEFSQREGDLLEILKKSMPSTD